MPKDELKLKLLESDGVNSLLSENRVASELRARGWTSVHGFYYEDAETKKHREVDVSATRTWLSGALTETTYFDSTTLNLLVECKNLRNSNLIFSEFVPPVHWMSEHYKTPMIFIRGARDNRGEASRVSGAIRGQYVGPSTQELQRLCDSTHRSNVRALFRQSFAARLCGLRFPRNVGHKGQRP